MTQERIIKLFNKYRALLKHRRVTNLTSAVNGLRVIRQKKNIIKSTKSKNQILDFYLLNGRWPSRKAVKIQERKLGARFENYASNAGMSADPTFRKIVLALGRKPTFKRKHDVKGFKQEILNFIAENKVVPGYVLNENEDDKKLRQKLDYYSRTDRTFLGKVYKLDPCHKSGILRKYRPTINSQIETDKPLVRLNKTELKAK